MKTTLVQQMKTRTMLARSQKFDAYMQLVYLWLLDQNKTVQFQVRCFFHFKNEKLSWNLDRVISIMDVLNAWILQILTAGNVISWKHKQINMIFQNDHGCSFQCSFSESN